MLSQTAEQPEGRETPQCTARTGAHGGNPAMYQSSTSHAHVIFQTQLKKQLPKLAPQSAAPTHQGGRHCRHVADHLFRGSCPPGAATTACRAASLALVVALRVVRAGVVGPRARRTGGGTPAMRRLMGLVVAGVVHAVLVAGTVAGGVAWASTAVALRVVGGAVGGAVLAWRSWRLLVACSPRALALSRALIPLWQLRQ